MRSKLMAILLVGAAALAVGLTVASAAGGADVGASATKSVSVKDDFFSPKAVRIASGGKVVWRWKGENDHNVKFRKVPAGATRPRGSTTKSSGRLARTFKKRGTYRYVCTIHQDLGMKGRVIVQ
jgi:plastocyanin